MRYSRLDEAREVAQRHANSTQEPMYVVHDLRDYSIANGFTLDQFYTPEHGYQVAALCQPDVKRAPFAQWPLNCTLVTPNRAEAETEHERWKRDKTVRAQLFGRVLKAGGVRVEVYVLVVRNKPWIKQEVAP